MKSIKEQIQDRCVHFTGIQYEKCKIGIRYKDVKDETGTPYKWPCLRDHPLGGGCKTCDSCQFPTEEEAEREAEVISNLCKKLTQ